MRRPLAALFLAFAPFAFAEVPSNPPAWAVEGGVAYQVFVRSFRDGDGDGVGDLRGVRDRLAYLADLGVRAIWLTPIHPSPSSHGYDVVDYRAIEPAFGTIADFVALTTAADRFGIDVILDLVVNHTSSLHPWFVAARAGVEPYRSWYRFERDPAPLVGTLGGPAWHPAGDGSHYLGLFTADMPDLNHRHPAVVDEMLGVAAFWLDLGADGFRIDAIQHVIESDDAIANTPENFAWLSAFATRLRASHPDAYLVGETWTSTPTIAAYHRAGLDVSLDYPTYRALLAALANRSAIDLRAQLRANDAAYPAGAVRATFVANHDQIRPATLLGALRRDPARLALLARLHLALPGAPFLYYGDEIGMPNASGDDDLAKRTPMRWGASDDGGFVGAWLAPSTRDPAISVIGQRGDPNEVFEATRAAIALRASHPALAVGDLTLEGDLPNAVLGFWRTAGDDAVLVLANLSAREVIVSKGGVTPVDGTHHPADAPGALGLAPLAVRLFAPAR